MIPENFSKSKSKGYLFLLSAILILSACNSTKQTADYPNFYSPHQKKTDTRFAGKYSTRKSSVTDTSKVTQPSIPYTLSNRKTVGVKPLLPNSVLYKKITQLITSGADIPTPKNNEGTLTASLSAEPLLSGHKFSAAIAGVPGITASDTTKNKVTQAPSSTINNDEQADLKKQDKLKAFAIVSLVSALLAIVTIFFAPGLALLLAAAAIVFGAIGLKSTNKKYRRMSKAGMGIVLAAVLLFIIAVIAFYASGGW